MASTTPVGIWFKSSRSNNGTGCVEVRFLPGSWFKSTRSDNGTGCVEVQFVPGVTGVRDSKNPTGPALSLTHPAWSAFIADIKSGVHNL